MLTFKASPLGTKEYWDSIYEKERECFNDNGDEGEVWFGEGVENRIISFLSKRIYNTIMDLGCGNGHLLRKLEERFSSLNIKCPSLIGFDYSENAIKMAKESSNSDKIEYFVRDIFHLTDDTPSPSPQTVDLIIDKGTFDAISLSGMITDPTTEKEDYERLKKIAIKYLSAVKKISPLLLLTSCNYTKEELSLIFPLIIDEIHHPSFKFASQIGQTVTTLLIDLSK